jgi:predicted dehydrogenase
MKYTAAVIGTGRIGYLLQKDKKREQPASHAAALSANRNVRLVAGCDINPERLELWQKDYPRTARYASAEELMRREHPDLVVVAVSETAHLEVALTVIRERPALVVLEKPVAPDPAAAEQIRRAAARCHVPVCVNHERRFSDDYRTAKTIIQSGGLGALQTVSAHLFNGAPVWSPGCKQDGGCSLLHDGTHLVDTLHFLLGRHLGKPHASRVVRGRDDKVRALNLYYRMPKDLLVYVELNGGSAYFDFEIRLTGTQGRLIIGNGYLKLYTRAPSPYYTGFYSLKRRREIKRPKKTGYFTGMVTNCVNFLDGREPLRSPLSEGIRTLKALYEIVDCIENRRPGP